MVAMVRRSCVAMLVAVTLATAGRAAAEQYLPVRGGTVVVPDFDRSAYHDSDSCQLALNAALRSLQDQLARIPFPPPGAPGYHEWANAITEQMRLLGLQRPPCLRLGPSGRSAPPAQARRLAAAAVPLARRFEPFIVRIAGSRGNPARQRALGAAALAVANGAAARFDLPALGNPKTWGRSQRLGVDLRARQIKQLPAFASRIQNVADYDAEIVGMTERRAAADPELAAKMDLLARANFGAPYAQLRLDQRRAIASQVQAESGALQNLIGRVRAAAAAATRVVFGGR